MASGKLKEFRRAAVHVLALACAIAVACAVAARGQAPLPPSGAPTEGSIPRCTTADLDATVQAAEGPSSWYTLAFNFRNISGHDCHLAQPSYPSFLNYSFPGNLPVKICRSCGEEPASGLPRAASSSLSVLKAGEVAHVAYEWKTEPPDQGASCLQPQSLATSVNANLGHIYVVRSKELLREICSPVDVEGYAEGFYHSTAPRSGPVHTPAPNIKLHPDTSTYYPREPIDLYATALEPAALLPPDRHSCPDFIQRTRGPDGTTGWDEIGISANPWLRCKLAQAQAEGTGQKMTVRFNSGHNNVWAGVGNTSVTLLQVVGADESGNILMARSNTIRLHIGNNVTMKRQWGPQVKGVAVNVTLDKYTYKLGQDIPLHIALENFSAPVPVLGLSTIWEPCLVVSAQVTGKDQLKRKDFFLGLMCTAGGPGGYFRYKKGVVVPLELPLGAFGQLPNKPGVYNVTVTWRPLTCAKAGCEQQHPPFSPGMYRPYAVVHDSATFEITDNQ